MASPEMPNNLSPEDGQILSLPDGRQLAWLECGDPIGTPVLFFHGTPDSRFGGMSFHQLAADAGLRIISPDRPGYGLSSYQPNRRFDDWSGDMKALLDHLNIDKALLWGISGGGAYCCVTARDLPERVLGVLSVCGMMPAMKTERRDLKLFVKIGLWAAKLPPALCHWFFSSIYKNMGTAEQANVQKKLAKKLPENFRDDPELPTLFHFMALSGKTNVEAGPEGARQEMQLYGQDADTLDIGCIEAPFTIMHGEADVNVPVGIARRVQASIPQTKGIYFPGETHTFWWPNRQRMIEELLLLLEAAQ